MSNRAWTYVLLACIALAVLVTLAILNTWMVG